jgi:DNA-binding SARP family transcriptional activator/TolB-like protein/Tfp pilus assembly protein PilF
VARTRQPAREKAPAKRGAGTSATEAPRPEELLTIALLGPFEVKRSDGETLRLPKKAQALLAYLAMQRGRPVPREQLATLLWGNSATEQARQSLRQCLAALRNTLGAEASEPLVADTASVLLAPSERWAVDVAAFEAGCQSKSVADLERAGALCRDEFLAGLQIPVEPFNDWLTLERQRLTSWRLDLLQRLTQARAEAGDTEGAIAAARQLNALDPLREDGHRLLMRLLAASGNRSAALKQHERCTQVLRDELGIAPDAETEDLADAIRAGRSTSPALREPASFPPTPPAAVGATSVASTGPPLPDKPSIVVLPFANLSGDASQDYFVDGLVEDITVALGRETWLFVIASPSAFALRDRTGDPREIAEKLGVRYVLRGSVRREARRVRIVVQLTDAPTGAHIWSDRVEDEVDNVFALNDRLMTQVAALLAPALRSVEIERAQRKPTSSLTAFDLYLRALPLFRSGFADNQEAVRLLDKAIALDPSYAVAYGFAARCYQFQKLMGWVRPNDPRLDEGVRLAHRAAELGRNDSEALWMAGLALVQLAGEIDHGPALIDRSLTLNPNSANAWTASCAVRTYLGDCDAAIDHFNRSQRLNPLDQSHHVHWNIVGMAYFAGGRFEDADAAADKALRARPSYQPGLRLKVATCGLLGRVEEGRAHVQRLLAVHPECSLAWIRDFWGPLMQRSPAALANYIEGSRIAGLPEGPHRSA